MSAFLGQVPLILGPSSWGFQRPLPFGIPPCPAGTFMDEDGFCRPTTALGRGGGGRVGPSFRRGPIESGFCGPEEIVGADGTCLSAAPLYNGRF